jgi:hypothetical protein
MEDQMISKRITLFLAACIFLSCFLSGCITTIYDDYNQFNTDPSVPKEKIALLACDPVYADINDPWIQLTYFNIVRINGRKTVLPGNPGLGFPATGWSGITELMPGMYDICVDLRYTTFGAGAFYYNNECISVKFEAQAGHTYLLSPNIDIRTHEWSPVLEDLTTATSSVKQWIDKRVSAESGSDNATPDAANQGSHTITNNSLLAIKVSNVSNPGQRPSPEDWLLATQTLEDGSTFELDFRFDPTKRHSRVYGKGLSFSEYLILYSKDGQQVEDIYEFVVGASTDKGRINNGLVLQKVGSNILHVIDYSAPRGGTDIYIQEKNGNYRFKESKRP